MPIVDPITSPTNSFVKASMALRKRRQRTREGRFLIDGLRALTLALQGGTRVIELLWCEEMASPDTVVAVKTIANDYPDLVVRPMSTTAFAKLAYGDMPDPLVAVAHTPTLQLADLPILPKQPLVVVVQGLEKPGNLGNILRTADGAGAHAVIVCDPVTDPLGPNVVRASRGTLFSLPLAVADTEATLHWLGEQGLHTVAALPDATAPYTDAPLTEGCALIVGGEHDGLPVAWQEGASHRVQLPMCGQADSLNVASTAAVLLYEAQRQRRLA